MTSTMLSPTELPFTDSKFDTTAAPPPKKKRKRTGTGGANDDCFACTSRSVKCDRKRPYCTQCIDIGKECSGYKTTLTWGVGVASRGKLRGLSCPIADKNADGSDVSQVEMDARRRRKSSTSNSKKEAMSKPSRASEVSPERRRDSNTATAFSEEVGYPQTYPPQIGPTSTPHLPPEWQTQGYQEHVYARRADGLRTQSHPFAPLQPLRTGLDAPFEQLSGPTSGRSVSSYSDAVFYSPMEYPRTPGSIPFSNPLTQSMSAPFTIHAGTAGSLDSLSMSGSSLGSYAESATSRVSSIQDQPDIVHNAPLSNGIGLEPIEEIFYSENDRGATPTSIANYSSLTTGLHVEDDDVDNEVKGLSLIDTRFNSPFFHVNPRLQTLMEYYDKAVCPYLVAFDGSENPYRKHVLQLAVHNEGLQHAIAALATNNHRMRTKELRQSGHLDELIDPFGDPTSVEPSGPSAEESCYKQMSIDTLNMQLTNASAAQDDSVLATLLILCLFHVCDSGFSKFKTQLAGVQKLLSYRQPNTQSDFTRWVEMFFTWFDVMTSTVNDREVQIKGESLAMLDFNVNLGAMEQFSGCDGRLFKLIARLGRLNLLAQGRPVRSQSGDPQPQRPASSLHPLPAHMGWHKRPHARISSLRAADYENMDGNGWGTPILSSDEDADGSADDDVKLPSSTTEDRSAFWTEWHDTRTRLEAWQMNHAHNPNPNQGDVDNDIITPERQDISHINESFRYAALLYTERLGHPLLPSSHDQFQSLVARALVHISALEVTSCVNKFLLWPLFIIGTECVDEQDRDIIRSRCRDVAEESGFYNNMSSLYVLERVWREVGSNVRGREAEEVRARRRDSEASRPGRYGQAFRWRKAMDRVDGEYIVI